MLRTILIATCLLAVTVPTSSLAAEASLPSWIQAFLDERGIVADASDLQVVRTVTAGGQTTSFAVPLSALVQAMRKTQQTSLYLDRLGPFFVGRAVWQGGC